MIYELGKQYEMKVVDIRKDAAGYNYIALHDDDPSKEYRVYNILKCQYESLPETLYVVVKSIDSFGKIKIKQDDARLIKEHYKEGKLYAFEITDIKEDYNTKKTYYVIEDDFTSHHYYFQGEQKYKLGDSCILEIEGFTDKGFLKLKEVEHVDDSKMESSKQEKEDTTESKLASLWASLPVLEGVEENDTLELKTSIVFPPGGKDADIDRQLYNILKELTAFMNTNGGVLYIGVHDKTKKVIGIEGDLQYLNDGEDEYAGSYSANTDSYELKIRNTMDKLCPSLANSIMKVEFPSLDGRVYCKITVQTARRPIFLSGTQLYVRQGNRVKLLKGDEITFFITERVTVSIKNIIDTDGLQVSNNGFDIESFKNILSKLINERRQIPYDLPKIKSLGEIDYWIIWYNDATWKRSRNKSDEENVKIQIPVYKSISNPIIAFCYSSGRVNTMALATFRKGVNLNKIQNNGWSRNEAPINIFVMAATDYLVGYSIDHNGTEFVKLHSISDYSQTASATNTGAPFVPDGMVVKIFATLGAEHRRGIENLVVVKAKRTSEAGTPLNSISLKGEIEYLENALKLV